MKSIHKITAALNNAISAAIIKCGKTKEFSRTSALSREAVVRLLIGAEGGSLDKILHTAGIQVTASAVTQRRAKIDPAVFRSVFDNFNTNCGDEELFRD